MIRLRLIQCIWTIWLVLVSAIGFFIVSPIPSKATNLCGQPLALEELLIGSSLQKGYVSTQVKVIEGNITNSFLISQEEEAPPSKQERREEGNKKECVNTAEKTRINNVQGTGKACKKDDAKEAAKNNIADTHCVNKNDPKCAVDEGCKNGKCKAKVEDKVGENVKCKEIIVEGCKDNKGYECTVSATGYACGCGCR